MVPKLGWAVESRGETVTHTELRFSKVGVGPRNLYASHRNLYASHGTLMTSKLEYPCLGVLPGVPAFEKGFSAHGI